MIRSEDVRKIGSIGKPHGVKGEFVFMLTDEDFLQDGEDCLIIAIDGLLVPFFIEEWRIRSSSTALVKLCGIDDVERARRFTGCEVYRMRRDDDDDEVALCIEDCGFTIIESGSGTVIGTVTAIDDTTANVLFEVTTPQGGTILIPASDDLIESVDNENKTITMLLPHGLLDINNR